MIAFWREFLNNVQNKLELFTKSFSGRSEIFLFLDPLEPSDVAELVKILGSGLRRGPLLESDKTKSRELFYFWRFSAALR